VNDEFTHNARLIYHRYLGLVRCPSLPTFQSPPPPPKRSNKKNDTGRRSRWEVKSGFWKNRNMAVLTKATIGGPSAAETCFPSSPSLSSPLFFLPFSFSLSPFLPAFSPFPLPPPLPFLFLCSPSVPSVFRFFCRFLLRWGVAATPCCFCGQS